VTAGSGKSWKVLNSRTFHDFPEPAKTIFQAWKVMENSKGHGKSWKISIMSWNFYSCTEKFCNVIVQLKQKLQELKNSG